MLSQLFDDSSLSRMFGIVATVSVGLSILASPVASQAVPPQVAEKNVLAQPFDLSQVTLNSGRWHDNQDRTLNYLKFVDVNRLLYVFRNNHKLSTNGAASNGGWDAPSFPFRSHMQGHFLTAWAQCYATLKDDTCKSKATTMTAALVACQNNNGAAGFSSGYLSGFPESDFNNLEAGKLTSGNVPYYVIHKTLAGLLDVWQHIGDNNAKTALLSLAAWVDTRTSKLSYSQMQSVLGTEFGGMSEVLTDIYFQTGDSRWLTTAQRFHHASVLTPLANNQDNLNGMHANTNVPKWIGAAREYKATGNTTYLNIARNAWAITTNAHTYAIGGNSKAEHFHEPNGISNYLTEDTCEHCNTYNMLKLTRELFAIDPSTTAYFDFYERALSNHIIGAQNPQDSHGAISYFSSLNPGRKRGLGPAWGGGTWSTDYNSFWCCQGTGVEVNTKHMDSIYYQDSGAVYVNLFHSSAMTWAAKGDQLTQTTTYPISSTTSIKVDSAGSGGSWAMKIRIPAWTSSSASIMVNGSPASDVTVTPGKYATVSRTWAAGDVVTVCLPMGFRTIAANDKKSVAAVAYGPVVLSGNYGSTSVGSMPSLDLGSLQRTSTSSLAFSGTANGQKVAMMAYYEAQNVNSVTYWNVNGNVPQGMSSCSA